MNTRARTAGRGRNYLLLLVLSWRGVVWRAKTHSHETADSRRQRGRQPDLGAVRLHLGGDERLQPRGERAGPVCKHGDAVGLAARLAVGRHVQLVDRQQQPRGGRDQGALPPACVGEPRRREHHGRPLPPAHLEQQPPHRALEDALPRRVHRAVDDRVKVGLRALEQLAAVRREEQLVDRADLRRPHQRLERSAVRHPARILRRRVRARRPSHLCPDRRVGQGRQRGDVAADRAEQRAVRRRLRATRTLLGRLCSLAPIHHQSQLELASTAHSPPELSHVLSHRGRHRRVETRPQACSRAKRRLQLSRAAAACSEHRAHRRRGALHVCLPLENAPPAAARPRRRVRASWPREEKVLCGLRGRRRVPVRSDDEARRGDALLLQPAEVGRVARDGRPRHRASSLLLRSPRDGQPGGGDRLDGD
mmetsp:Transcript_36174/g.116852  ORF Transcript_36174/g.116852 Transcript_36174/m.116852 type:complete len:421 (+) Transcript_36174:55-1317(+)